ncbi:MAG: transposase [Gemmataceae bacterium]
MFAAFGEITVPNPIVNRSNRSANRPSHEGAANVIDEVTQMCLEGGFEKVLVRGDTDFSQTEHLDRWHQEGRIEFVFGYNAYACLKSRAENLPSERWQELTHEYEEPVTNRRCKPTDVRAQKVRERGYTQLRTRRQEVNEFDYQPTACRRPYRMVVVKKYIDVYKHGELIDETIRYFFFITNDTQSTRSQIVESAHARCNQENLISQLKSGCYALWARVDTLP